MSDRLFPDSPYPFAPFMALTPMEAAFLFQELGFHMVDRHAGALSTHRAGGEELDATHLTDIHNLGRMGAIGLWQHVDQSGLSHESRELIHRCDEACKTYAIMMSEALDWWSRALRNEGIAVDRRSSISFRERYDVLGWGFTEHYDTRGFLAVMQWRSGQSMPSKDEEILRRALPEDGGDYAARLDGLEQEIRDIAAMLASPDCPLGQESTIDFVTPDGERLTILNRDHYLTRLYCLNHIAYGLNDSRHHHPLLIPSFKQHTKEAVDSAKRLGECDSLMMEASRTEHYRAMMNPAMAVGDAPLDVFAQSKAKAWAKLSSLPHTEDNRLDYSGIFVRDYAKPSNFYDYMDWLLIGRAMECYDDLPDYLKPLAAYMEDLRQQGGLHIDRP